MSAVKPVKLLQINVTDIEDQADWGEDDGSGDPFIGFPYRWTVTFSVTTQTHSNYQTPTPFFYDGLDVNVGDWIATVNGGSALKIISISTQASDHIICIAEDVERYNTFSDFTQNGAGSIPLGSGYLFSLDDDNNPIIFPVQPGYLPDTFITDLMSRFRHRNYLRNFVSVRQVGHTMTVGSAIYLSGVTYFKAQANSLSTDKIIGFVTEVGVPGLEYFTYRPIGRIVDNISPILPGNPGDLVYVSDITAGAYISTKPLTNARAVYIKLSDTRGIQLDRPDLDETKEKIYLVPSLVDSQVNFTLPSDAREVLTMSINGIETMGFLFSPPNLVFNPISTGYGLEVGDEVIFAYRT